MNRQYIWLQGQPIGLIKGANVYYIHADHLGRPEVVTNASKSVVWRATNGAYDRTVTTDSIGNLNLGFPGQYYDQESGLWYNWHRYYDADTGRYTQGDPIGLLGGLQTYGYVSSDPVNFVDELGLQAQLREANLHNGVIKNSAMEIYSTIVQGSKCMAKCMIVGVSSKIQDKAADKMTSKVMQCASSASEAAAQVGKVTAEASKIAGRLSNVGTMAAAAFCVAECK